MAKSKKSGSALKTVDSESSSPELNVFISGTEIGNMIGILFNRVSAISKSVEYLSNTLTPFMYDLVANANPQDSLPEIKSHFPVVQDLEKLDFRLQDICNKIDYLTSNNCGCKIATTNKLLG